MSESFPYVSHLTLKDADALQVLRECMTDDEVMKLFAARSQRVRDRVAAFLKRNARPAERAA